MKLIYIVVVILHPVSSWPMQTPAAFLPVPYASWPPHDPPSSSTSPSPHVGTSVRSRPTSCGSSSTDAFVPRLRVLLSKTAIVFGLFGRYDTGERLAGNSLTTHFSSVLVIPPPLASIPPSAACSLTLTARAGLLSYPHRASSSPRMVHV
ncbi:hypothetical protein V8E53_012433, partial [Lactarius tabidus]